MLYMLLLYVKGTWNHSLQVVEMDEINEHPLLKPKVFQHPFQHHNIPCHAYRVRLCREQRQGEPSFSPISPCASAGSTGP